ncbi:MAG: rod shape-determining protein MreC [Lachnospiraceae bacterium]|jgi:rod shape-determining protein MreC|nr:rod shape-determining protein MreC [Lachnospiraceae bacterium]
MRRRTKFTLEPKVVLIFFLVLCLLLIITSFLFKGFYAPIRGAVGEVVSPMQKGINTVGTFFTSKTDNFKSMNELMKENKQLKKQLNSVNYENKILQQEKYELAELRKLFELDEKYASYDTVAARVIDKDAGNWYSVFKIDKGSKDGMKVGMNVMAGDSSGGGLVGIITQTGKNWSKVRSIIDDTSKVGAMILKTNETCIVSGNLTLQEKGLLEFSEMDNSEIEYKAGAEVVTSYLSDKFHQGILIGYIKEVVKDENANTRTGYITPAVDFTHLETVLIIKQLKEELDTEEDD